MLRHRWLNTIFIHFVLHYFLYETRLKKLGLRSLEHRRVRADLIEVYKIIHGLFSVEFDTFFEFSTYERTSGHSLKLTKNRARTELRQHFFSERVVNIWNRLGDDTVCAQSLNCFKHHLEKLHKDKSFDRLLQSVWLSRVEAEPVSPLVRPHLVSYLVSYYQAVRQLLLLHLNLNFSVKFYTDKIVHQDHHVHHHHLLHSMKIAAIFFALNNRPNIGYA